MVENNRELPREGRVIGTAIGHGRGDKVAVAVLVLQALAPQGCFPRSSAHQEAAGALVGGSPDQVADALEAEH